MARAQRATNEEVMRLPTQGPVAIGRAQHLTGEQREAFAEADKIWKRLAVALLMSERLRSPWVIGVTSAIHGEGRTTSALALAGALAHESDRRVCLVSTEAGRLGGRQAEGGPETKEPTIPLWSAAPGAHAGNPALLRFGAPGFGRDAAPSDISPVRIRHEFPEMVKSLRQQFAHSVIDLPPLLESIEAEEMVRHLDGTLLVVRAGVTPLEKIKAAAPVLSETNLLGVVHMGPPTAVPQWITQLLGA